MGNASQKKSSSSGRPSIKDEDTYEALRDEGASKEKAARIANSGAVGSRKGGEAPPYEEWTKDALYDQAQDVGIDGRSKMSKAELIDALRNH
ncbi:MAG: Rho termination factor [Pseudomonadota bacterium]